MSKQGNENNQVNIIDANTGSEYLTGNILILNNLFLRHSHDSENPVNRISVESNSFSYHTNNNIQSQSKNHLKKDYKFLL